MLTAGFLTLLVMGVLFPNLWYGMHDITDLPVYWGYAARIAEGEAPFTTRFQVEYPPLAVALFRVPGHTGSESLYGIWFNILMGADHHRRRGGDGVHRLPPVAARRASLRRLGPLPRRRGAHRDDRAQPLRRGRGAARSPSSSCASRRAGTPPPGSSSAWASRSRSRRLALLPLVLLLAGPPRRWAWPLVAFVAAAVAPFVPYVLKSWSGVWHIFQYHLERPLQIESVLGTPQLLGQLLGADWASWAWSHGSHSLVAPGVGLARRHVRRPDAARRGRRLPRSRGCGAGACARRRPTRRSSCWRCCSRS